MLPIICCIRSKVEKMDAKYQFLLIVATTIIVYSILFKTLKFSFDSIFFELVAFFSLTFSSELQIPMKFEKNNVQRAYEIT